MIQVIVGITIAIAGIAMLLERSWVAGIGLLAFGAAILDGARHGVWLRFGNSESDPLWNPSDGDASSDGDGGGDGGD